MQFSAVLNIFILKTKLNSTFTNDLKRKLNFSKNVHSYRVCSFKDFRNFFFYVNFQIGELKVLFTKKALYL